jgi:ATP-dependent DNA helicase DinG
MVDNRILPEYKYLIIDEAHNFGKEMFDHLACRLSRIEILKLLESLHSNSPRGRRSLVFQLRQSYPHLLGMTTEIANIVDRLNHLTTEAFSSLTPAGNGIDSSSSRVLTEDDMETDWYVNAQSILSQDWKPNWDRLMLIVAELAQELEGLPEAEELLGILASLKIVDEIAFSIIEQGFYVEDSLMWLEMEEGHRRGGLDDQIWPEPNPQDKWVAAWCASRIDNWDRIGGMLYAKLDSMIMVSATLTIENDFSNFIHRNGLADYVHDEKMVTFIMYLESQLMNFAIYQIT